MASYSVEILIRIGLGDGSTPEHAFQNIVCKMSAIATRPQHAKNNSYNQSKHLYPLYTMKVCVCFFPGAPFTNMGKL